MSSDSFTQNRAEPVSRAAALPTVVLAMAAGGLATSVLLVILVTLGIIAVPWDATVLPLVTIAGLLSFCVIALLLPCISCYLYRDIRSVLAIVIGLLATAAALGTSFLIVVTAIANHPI